MRYGPKRRAKGDNMKQVSATVAGVVLGVAFGLCVIGCAFDTGKQPVIRPAETVAVYGTEPTEPPTTTHNDGAPTAAPATPITPDAVVGETMTVIGILTGSPLLVTLGVFVGRFKPIRRIKTLITAQQAGRDAIRHDHLPVLRKMDAAVREVQDKDPPTSRLVRKVKSKMKAEV